MGACRHCSREIPLASTCTHDLIVLPTGVWRRHRFRARPGVRRCGACGVADGGVHHSGCDMEDCPSCNRQLITCGFGLEPNPEEDGPEHFDVAMFVSSGRDPLTGDPV